jgi:predicted MFS family arabinose efflux permease
VGAADLRRTVLLVAVAIAVAVAFADSSIVVLALPELYGAFDTTIEGVAWVITSFNLALALGALALVPIVRRVRAATLLGAGSLLFLATSVVCAMADSIGTLVVARSGQGLGAALVLTGSLPVLGSLAGSREGARALWTTAGTIGAAAGPALGGLLTQAFDWRAIFVAQAPVAGVALFAIGTHAIAADRGRPVSLGSTIRPNAALALASGALVGALFLGVLLVVDVFRYTPIEGAAIVSLIPIGAVFARPLANALPHRAATASGIALVAAGLVGLALPPSNDIGYALVAFALCGSGLGLAVPGLTASALAGEGLGRPAAMTVGIRHLGLVLALAVVAPVLANDLVAAADVAELNAAAVVIDSQIPATTKIPLALDIRDALDRAARGEIPDLSAPFEEHGAATDASIRRVQDDLTDTIATAVTRGFRSSFLVCAALGGLALLPLLLRRRREESS